MLIEQYFYFLQARIDFDSPGIYDSFMKGRDPGAKGTSNPTSAVP